MLTTIMAISIAAACIVALPLYFGVGGWVVLTALFAWFFCACATYDNCRRQYDDMVANYGKQCLAAKYHNQNANAYYQCVLTWVFAGLLAYTWWYFLRQPWYSAYGRSYLYALTAASVITFGQTYVLCYIKRMILLDETVKLYTTLDEDHARLRSSCVKYIGEISRKDETLEILSAREKVLEEQIHWQAGELKTLRLHLSPPVEAEEEEETAPPFVLGVMRVQQFTNPGA